MFGWFKKKETQAERIRRELQSFNEENLPLEYLPELDVPLSHNPPLGLDVNVPYLLGQIIPKKRDRLIKEREKLTKRLEAIGKELQMLSELKDVTDRAS